MAKFFITTPIYYVNDVPHMGHAYTTIAADVLARYHRLMGDDVFFLTGTDEHGQNIERIAAEKKVTPKEYCDEVVAQFRGAWRTLDISNDYFVRTTDERHIQAVGKFATALLASGDVYRDQYKGWYCPRCEAFFQPEELLPEHLCPIHKRSCEWTEEENYFFALSRYQERLMDLVGETFPSRGSACTGACPCQATQSKCSMCGSTHCSTISPLSVTATTKRPSSATGRPMCT